MHFDCTCMQCRAATSSCLRQEAMSKCQLLLACLFPNIEKDEKRDILSSKHSILSRWKANATASPLYFVPSSLVDQGK